MTRYSDKLIEITDTEILFRAYYFPVGAKRVKWADAAGVSAHKPTLANGRYKLWGGDGFTWLPLDAKRPGRTVMFSLSFPRSRHKINFTVEDSQAVKGVLESLGVLR